MNPTINPLFQQIFATTIGEGRVDFVNKTEWDALREADQIAKEAQEGTQAE